MKHHLFVFVALFIHFWRLPSMAPWENSRLSCNRAHPAIIARAIHSFFLKSMQCDTCISCRHNKITILQDLNNKKREVIYTIEYSLGLRNNGSIRPFSLFSFLYHGIHKWIYIQSLYNTMHQVTTHDEVQVRKKNDFLHDTS